MSKAVEQATFKPHVVHRAATERRQPDLPPALHPIAERRQPEPPPIHHAIAEKRHAESAPKIRDPRELGFSRRRDHSGDIPEERPNLPRRRNMTESIDSMSAYQAPISARQEHTKPVLIPAPPRPSDHSKPGASHSQDDKVGNFPPPPKRNPIPSMSRAATDLHAPRPISLSSAILRNNHEPLSTGLSQSPPPRRHIDDSDDHAVTLDDTPLLRTDYPDSSYANRRAPFFRDGPKEIHIKQDSRIFDVCGQYICTTGYLTRVWDLSNGEQLMTLTHGESTVKMLSVAFKPGAGLEEEGSRLWLGSNGGDIHEVDIEAQSIVSTRNAHSRREVIKIYRYKSELWTLDEDGKILVWPADESGVPNLQYSPQSFKVPRGHTFSMVVGGQLWLATGKDLRIFRPGAGDAGFQVLSKPLNQPHAGEITSGTISRDKGGCVYLGHTDGKVTIYSTKDYACLATVNVSVYKINNLASVGNYLWAAYKTGMIYVYDTSTHPWTVKKDWHAHLDPVTGLLLDPSSVWKLQRLQVVSLGSDNNIKLWDASLEDDWLG
jgi:WD40 repeat protein